MTQLEQSISLVQERALEQAEIDSIGTWLGGEEENYTIVETDHMHGGVSRLFQLIYRVSQEERTKLREGVPYVKLYRYNPKHLYPKLNGYRDNGKRSLKL